MNTISLQVRLVVLAVTASATLIAVTMADQVPWQDWPRLLLFFGLIVLASSVRVSDPRGRSVTPSIVLTYLAIYTFNPPTVLLVIAAGRTIGYVISRSWVPWRALANGAQSGLSAALGASVFALLGGSVGRVDTPHTYVAVLLGALAHQWTNSFFVALVVSRWRGTPLLTTWVAGIRDFFWPNLLSIPTAFVLALLYERVHFSVIVAYLALLPLQVMALRLYIKRRDLYAQIVDGLVVATDVNFPLGRGHGRRVADLAVAISREMRLSESTVESIEFAALLHDVGMIGKDDILDRPVLTPEDADGLRDHVRVGAEIAKELPRKEIAESILRHHERYDGTGYPGGLRGEAIPLGARIIAVAEAVDSMASGTFPYTSPFSPRSVVSYVASETGRAFDPEVTDAFLRVVQHGSVALAGFDIPTQQALVAPRLGEVPAR